MENNIKNHDNTEILFDKPDIIFNTIFSGNFKDNIDFNIAPPPKENKKNNRKKL